MKNKLEGSLLILALRQDLIFEGLKELAKISLSQTEFDNFCSEYLISTKDMWDKFSQTNKLNYSEDDLIEIRKYLEDLFLLDNGQSLFQK